MCKIKNEKMTAKRMIKVMQQNFRLKQGADSDDGDGLLETVLVSGAFLYKCYNCEEQCHKANLCPRKKDNQSFDRECNYYGGKGHKEAACWSKPENESKKPA